MTNLHQASLPTVRVEFYAITQGDKETVLAYTSRVDIIVATLAKLGERVSTGAWIYALGNGLRAEYKESKDGILYNKPGFDSVISVKTILLSEEAVLTSKNKKANDTIKATKEKDDEIALKLKELKISTDKKLKEPKEPTDKSLYIKGKGGKGDMKGKGGTKGRNINESSPWPTPWNSPEGSSTTQYANWHPPAKGKGYVKPKVDPSLLWCDIHQTYGHSTDWCFENPYRTGGPPLPNSRPWCDSCHSHGHTSDTCWANSPRSQTPKGKGKPQNQKGKGGKGQYGDRRWKSQNFPAAYNSEQATPALHDESPSKDTSQEWWDAKEIGSSCFETKGKGAQATDSDDEYDDVEIAEEIDFHFLAIIQNIERQRAYLLAPTAEKLNEFNEHEGFISQAASLMNIHSQRIVLNFREQLGYVGCMDTFILRTRCLEEDRKHNGFYMTEESTLTTNTKLEIEIDTHLRSKVDTHRNDGMNAYTSFDSELETLSSNAIINLELESNLETGIDTHRRDSETNTTAAPPDGAPESRLGTNFDLEITPLKHELAIHTVKALLVHKLESELKEKLQLGIDTHLDREIDMATAKSLLEYDPALQLTMKFEMIIDTHLERDL